MKPLRVLVTLLNWNQERQISIITEDLPTERKEISKVQSKTTQKRYSLIHSILKPTIIERSVGTKLDS
jgi:hypothetical protein